MSKISVEFQKRNQNIHKQKVHIQTLILGKNKELNIKRLLNILSENNTSKGRSFGIVPKVFCVDSEGKIGKIIIMIFIWDTYYIFVLIQLQFTGTLQFSNIALTSWSSHCISNLISKPPDLIHLNLRFSINSHFPVYQLASLGLLVYL